MKKSIYTIVLLVFGVLFATTSCNKKDLDELDTDVSNNQNSIDHLNGLVPYDNGISGTITGNRRVDSVAFTIDYQHRFLWNAAYDDSQVYDNGDGTYNFTVQRYNDISGDSYSEFEIYNYDPSVGMSSAEAYGYVRELAQADDIKSTLTFWAYGYTDCCGNTATINSLSYDEATRMLNFSMTIEHPEDDLNNSTRNPGTITLNFSGKMEPGNNDN